MPIVTRFAPSPTGHLHLGHAFSALTAWRRAREAGGRFLLRLEDIDPARCRPEFAPAILRDLEWLGLDWDGEVRVQSQHLAEYRATLDALAERGLLYPCFCTRADIQQSVAAPHAPDGAPRYPGTCRTLSAADRAVRIASGEPHALRLDMPLAVAAVPDVLRFHEAGEGVIACNPAAFGDVVLARKDAPASYHLCVTHDDAVQGVTLVTRGMDLRPATHLHRLLQALLGWPVPDYAHHRLLTDATGRRLAKRDRAATLRALREAGRSPAEVRALALVVLVLVGVGVFFGYPLLNEDASGGECDALERMAVRLALGADAAKPQDQLLGQLFQGLSKGQLASVLVRHEYPNVPVTVACTTLYWRAILDPKGFRADAAKLRS